MPWLLLLLDDPPQAINASEMATGSASFSVVCVRDMSLTLIFIIVSGDNFSC